MLKPGGVLLVRDYGRHGPYTSGLEQSYFANKPPIVDMAQLRFKKNRYMQPGLYIRGDKTRVYFFERGTARLPATNTPHGASYCCLSPQTSSCTSSAPHYTPPRQRPMRHPSPPSHSTRLPLPLHPPSTSTPKHSLQQQYPRHHPPHPQPLTRASGSSCFTSASTGACS